MDNATINATAVAYADATADVSTLVNATRCLLAAIVNSSVAHNDSLLCPGAADVITEPNTRAPPRANSCSEGPGYVRWLGDVVILPPIVVFGVIGNILSFIVLCLQKTNMITTILLRFLAVVDTLLLLAAIPLRFMKQLNVCHDLMDSFGDIHSLYIFRFGYPCLFVLRMAGTWTTTLLTVDRYIAVCRPLQAKRLVTTQLATIQIIVVAIGSVIISLPAFFEWHIVRIGDDDYFLPRDFAKSQWYVYGYKVTVIFLIMYIIPIVNMVIFNVLLMRNLRIAAKGRAVLHEQRSGSNNDAKLNNSITNIVIAVVLVFLVCNTMPLISHSLWSLEKIDKRLFPTIENPRRYFSQISNIFVSINSAVNFLIYCVCCRGFRTTFMHMIFGRRLVKKQSTPCVARRSCSASSGHTYVQLLENGHKKVVRDNNSSLLGAYKESNNM